MAKEKVDLKKIIKDLQGDFGSSNEKQMGGLQLLKGLATSDEAISNTFMQKLDKAITAISKEILGESKKESIKEGYETDQINDILPYDEYGISVQLRTTNGKTKWMTFDNLKDIASMIKNVSMRQRESTPYILSKDHYIEGQLVRKGERVIIHEGIPKTYDYPQLFNDIQSQAEGVTQVRVSDPNKQAVLNEVGIQTLADDWGIDKDIIYGAGQKMDIAGDIKYHFKIDKLINTVLGDPEYKQDKSIKRD